MDTHSVVNPNTVLSNLSNLNKNNSGNNSSNDSKEDSFNLMKKNESMSIRGIGIGGRGKSTATATVSEASVMDIEDLVAHGKQQVGRMIMLLLFLFVCSFLFIFSATDFFFSNECIYQPTTTTTTKNNTNNQSMCPYYLSRNSIPSAELVVMPYNYLLDPRTRESLKVVTVCGCVFIYIF